MSYCTKALALRADYSRSKIVTKTFFEWLWCWIIPSSGGGGRPWIECEELHSQEPMGCGNAALARTCCCSHVELQKWNVAQVLQPCLDTWTEPWEIPHWAISVPHLCLLCEFFAGAGQAMGWVSVFSPWSHVHKLEQVSLSAGSVLPCPEVLFPWDLRCNGNTATPGNRPQCHKAKGFFWLWLNSWLAWSLV